MIKTHLATSFKWILHTTDRGTLGTRECIDGSKLSIKSEAGLESTDSGIDPQPIFPST